MLQLILNLLMINISLHTGVLLDVLKEASVFPIHKGGPSKDPSNDRPISILPVVSKVISLMRIPSAHVRN